MASKRKLTTVSFLALLFVMSLSAQTSDLFRVEYLNIPNTDTKNSIDRFRVLFQLPLKIKEDHYLIIGSDYRYLDLKLDNVPFTTTDLESVQTIEASLAYLHKVKQSNWYYGLRVGMRLASNFEDKMVSDDYLYLVSGFVINDKTKEGVADKPNRLILGFDYSSTPFRNYPLLILNYYREFSPHWTYTVGVPKTNLRYKINETNHVQAFVTLDNFFANIQANKVVDGKVAENISQTLVIGGLGYEYYFTEHLLYYGYAGYSIINDYRLRNNDGDDIYIIDNKPTLYFKTGIKFKY